MNPGGLKEGAQGAGPPLGSAISAQIFLNFLH